MKKIVKCKICGKEFLTKTANATMCSPECRKINHNRMCSNAQKRRRKAQKERIAAGLEESPKQKKKVKRKWTKPNYKPRKCERCGKEFQPNHPKEKYCSEKCRYPNRVVKEETEKPMSELARINAEARAHGMRYGGYVGRYGV